MKALKITFEHGRIWKAETSDGRSASGANLQSVLDKMLVNGRPSDRTDFEDDGYDAMRILFDRIKDTGSDGQIARGQASG